MAVEVVLMTSQASVSAGVAAVKAGAFDYLTKPFTDDERLQAHAAPRPPSTAALRRRASALEGMLYR